MKRGFWLIPLILILVSCAPVPKEEPGKVVDMLNGKGPYEIITEDVLYFENVKGFLARPKETGNYPGIVMIHEWWGLNDNIKEMARTLASQGYIVLAVDMYNGEVAANSTRAQQLSSSFNQEKGTQNMKSAVAYLKTNFNVPKIASLGWCFGGGQSMQLALAEKLDATVIYYGTLVTDEARLSAITWPVLGIFGDKDTAIPVESARTFDAALDKLGIENEIYIYPGVGHAFANPSGANYAPTETKDAWDKTVKFLNKHLKGE